MRSYLHVGGRGLNRQHETGRQKEFDKIPKKNLHLNNKRKEKQEGVISHLTAREEKTKKKHKDGCGHTSRMKFNGRGHSRSFSSAVLSALLVLAVCPCASACTDDDSRCDALTTTTKFPVVAAPGSDASTHNETRRHAHMSRCAVRSCK